MFSRWTVRSQILLLVGLLIVPLVGLLLYEAWNRVNLRRLESEHTIQDIAALVSTGLEELTTNTRDILRIIVQLPVIQHLSDRSCDPISKNLNFNGNIYANAVIFDREGNLVCTAIDHKGVGRINASDRDWFRRARQSPGFNISEPYLGRLTGELVIMFSYPITDENGNMTGVFGLPVSLRQLSAEVSMEHNGKVITVVSSEGNVIVRTLEPESWLGKNIRDAGIDDLIGFTTEGVAEGKGLDGEIKLFANQSLQAAPWRVHVGLPLKYIEGPVRKQLLQGLAVVALITIIAVVMAVLLIWRIIRPLGRLVAELKSGPEPEYLRETVNNAPPEIRTIAEELWIPSRPVGRRNSANTCFLRCSGMHPRRWPFVTVMAGYSPSIRHSSTRQDTASRRSWGKAWNC